MGVQERRARERQGIRDEILDAARGLFAREGYESVSIRKIANKIEYSPGAIYLYFRDKTDILDTLCEETFARLAKSLRPIVEDTDDPLERLRRAGRAYIDFAIENPNHYLITFVSKSERLCDSNNAEQIEASGAACFQNLRGLVQRCVEQDRLRITDVEEVSQSLWACMHGVATLLITCEKFPFIERSRLIDRVLDIEGLDSLIDRAIESNLDLKLAQRASTRSARGATDDTG